MASETCQPSTVAPQCYGADADWLVLEKPAGLLCVPGRGPDKQDCLSARAQAHWSDALIVHRLDQATSGLLLMARNPGAQRLLGQAFAARQVVKTYHAVVAGLPPATPDAQGWSLIDLPLGADWPQRPRQKIDAVHGKPSQTRWRILHHDAQHQRTRLELCPHTGRTHQLRVHLAAIGHPIVGDALYAPAALHASHPSARLLLHAGALYLQHPRTGHWERWTSPVPF